MSRLPILMITGALGLVLAVAPADGHKDKRTRPADPKGGKSSHTRPSNGPSSRTHPVSHQKKKGKGQQGTKVAKRRPAKKKLTSKHRKRLTNLLNSKDLNSGEKAAIGKLLSGEPLSGEERDQLANLAASGRAGLTAEDREAISQGLSDDQSAKTVAQNLRTLRVRNATREKLIVYVQYQTVTSADEWAWHPADPGVDRRALVFHIQPGAVTYLTDARTRINASRVRIWARSESGGRWDQYRGRDLWLVTELDDSGEHSYYAAQIDTYTFTFRP